ncbi:MAG: hypothetical protein WCE94_14415 [Candidatus Methanoperedens sp.]
MTKPIRIRKPSGYNMKDSKKQKEHSFKNPPESFKDKQACLDFITSCDYKPVIQSDDEDWIKIAIHCIHGDAGISITFFKNDNGSYYWESTGYGDPCAICGEIHGI